MTNTLELVLLLKPQRGLNIWDAETDTDFSEYNIYSDVISPWILGFNLKIKDRVCFPPLAHLLLFSSF